MDKAILYLEDGSVFTGISAGKKGITVGEIVFNTSMTGYLEILTDPSYSGQLITMTYPLIGNYGVNEEHVQSSKIWAKGFIVRELCDNPSNWTSTKTLNQYLIEHDTVAIQGIDTRELTVKIRDFGNMVGIISDKELTAAEVNKLVTDYKNEPKDFVEKASCEKPYEYTSTGDIKINVLDLGIKKGIIDQLAKRNVHVCVFPYNTSAEKLLENNPDGILLSNGPGDPKDVVPVLNEIKKLVGKVPLCGICLGHQLLGLALGFDTYKLKFGHHGGNHAVKELKKDKTFMSSQNHNYALREANFADIEVTHINVTDNTIEGIRHKKLPICSVQYHPEACPGPNDSCEIFDDFITMIKEN